MQQLPPELAAIMGTVLIIACAVLIVVLVIYIFYFLTLQKALSRCAPHNRLMEPGMVWLGIVPCVNLVWQFMIASQVPGSLKNEFRERNRDDDGDYGKSIAMTQAILTIVNIPLSQSANVMAHQVPEAASLIVSLVSLVVSLVTLILFIVFWVKIAGYSAMLAADPGDQYRDRRLDAFDDDDGYGGAPKGESSGPSDAIKPGDPGQYQ